MIYLIKTDSEGNIEWSKIYGGSGSDEGTSVRQTHDKGYIIAGWTTSATNSSDMYLIKTDSLGDTLWMRTYGGQGSDRAYSIDETIDGGYIICGHSNSFGCVVSASIGQIGVNYQIPLFQRITITY